MRITRFLHSRYAVVAATVTAVAAVAFAGMRDTALTPIAGDRGVVFASANGWIDNPDLSLWISVALNVGIAMLMIFINRTYNVLRSVTMLYATLFAVMQMATPDLEARLNSGTIMAALLIGSYTLLFATFGNPAAPSRRLVFLIFALLSAGATTQYCFLFYLPVLVAACMQMRIFTLRTAVAALLGLITPWWIIFGLGIASPGQLHLPHMVSVFSDIGSREAVLLLVTAGFTVFAALAAWALCFMKMLGYNARTRACNGVLTLTMLMSMVAMAADYTNMVVYIPTLNMCASIQVAHFFALHRRERSWIAILSFISVYVALYLWRMAI